MRAELMLRCLSTMVPNSSPGLSLQAEARLRDAAPLRLICRLFMPLAHAKRRRGAVKNLQLASAFLEGRALV
jgi:hypothetical protein